MIMEFEENFLDLIVSECTSNTLFDEYVNYEQIVSESIVLSENQEMKLSVLREFSIKDIGKKIVGAFKAIKTFIKNLIFKLGVFIKNIGKEEIFKNVGKAISELSPEERKEIIEYGYYDELKLEKVDTSVIKNMDNCINYVMKALKTKDKDVDVSWDEFKNKYISNKDDIFMHADLKLHRIVKSGTKIEAYKYYTMVSKKLDEAYNYFNKLANKIYNQADKLEKLADNWTIVDDDGNDECLKIATDISRRYLLPTMREINASYLKGLASIIAKENKYILTEAIRFIKGGKLKKDAEELKDETFNDKESDVKESYTPWNDLD